MTKQRSEYSKREYAGSFQPLGYYERLGYDIKKIEQDTPTRDTETHPILGITYKVAIRHESVGEIEKTIREQVLKWKAETSLEGSNDLNNNGKEGQGTAEAKVAGSKQKETNDSESGSSSSSSSASGSKNDSKKKAMKEKRKEEKRKRKAAAKLKQKEAKRQKEADNVARGIRTTANSIMSKLVPVMHLLSRGLQDEDTKGIPGAVKKGCDENASYDDTNQRPLKRP